jgi:hypothetical protein
MPPSTHDHSNYRPSRIDKKFYRSCKYGGGSGSGGGGENSDDKHALFTRSVDSALIRRYRQLTPGVTANRVGRNQNNRCPVQLFRTRETPGKSS